MKTAILQVADTGPLESLVEMLDSVGYRCLLPDRSLSDSLRRSGCDTVLSVEHLVRDWGYDEPAPLDSASYREMDQADLYVDVKAHRNGPIVWRKWPRLEDRTLWYRINGGRPEHVIRRDGFDCGNEARPPCPILTPNRWYVDEYETCDRCNGSKESPPGEMCRECQGDGETKVDWYDTPRYPCWPPFVRFGDYGPRDWVGRPIPPVCLVHNLVGWGYGALVDRMRTMGVRCHGVRSPDGLIPHSAVPGMLSRTLAMVHLKSSDAPGYAIYECLAAACPLICTRRLIWRCRMQDLLIPGETCLVFDRETHDALGPQDVEECSAEVRRHLETLRDPGENRRIGEAGRRRLSEVVWRRDRDGGSLADFFRRYFP